MSSDIGADIPDEQWECDKCTFINMPSDLTCTACYTVRSSTKDIAVTWQWQAADAWIPFDLPACIQIEHAFQKGEKLVKLTAGYFSDNPGYTVTFESKKGKGQSRGGKYRFYQTNTHSGNRRAVRRIADDDDHFLVPVPFDRVKGDKCGICQLEWENEENEEEGEDPQQSSQKNNTSDSSSLPPAAAAAAAAAAANSHENGAHNGTNNNDSRKDNDDDPDDEEDENDEESTSGSSGSGSNEGERNVPRSSGARDPEEPVSLPKCKHHFHRACIAKWIKLNDSCPSCRTRLM